MESANKDTTRIVNSSNESNELHVETYSSKAHLQSLTKPEQVALEAVFGVPDRLEHSLHH